MHRFIRRGGIIALPALLIGLGTGAAVALPAQAASTWSAPVPLPAGVGSQGFAENTAGAQVATWASYNETTAVTSVEVSTSANGLTWSTPVTLNPGENDLSAAPVAAIAPNGRIVVAWNGGPVAARVIQASVLAPGGNWSAPANLSTNNLGGPMIGMDGSGNTIVTWLGGGRQIESASLPAGGSWTAEKILDSANAGYALDMAVNSAGSVVLSWAEARVVWADSGTILDGFAAPVTVGSGTTAAIRGGGQPVQATLDAYQSPGRSGIPRVPSIYFVGHTQVVLSNSGIAVLQWDVSQTAYSGVAIRSAAGTWSITTGGGGDNAIDGAGNIVSAYAVTSASGVSSVYISKLPAGSSTWSSPVLLAVGSGPAAVGDAAGTFVVVVRTASGVAVFTSPPSGNFGAAATFPAADMVSALMIVPGHAALVLNSDAVSTEPVS